MRVRYYINFSYYNKQEQCRKDDSCFTVLTEHIRTNRDLDVIKKTLSKEHKLPEDSLTITNFRIEEIMER